MPRKKTTLAFREAIASCLKEALRDKKVGKSELAKSLGIKRQTLWLYLHAKAAPGPEVLRKISKLYKLILNGGVVVKPEDFGPEHAPRPPQKQLNLFEALDEIKESQIKANVVGRVGKYYEFRVRIKVAS